MYQPQENGKGTVHPIGPPHLIFVFLILMLAANSCSASAQVLEGPSADGTAPAEIVWMMFAQNETLARELRYFSTLRHYHVDVNAAGQSMSADMHVQVACTAGAGKVFHIVDQSGCRVLLTHVLKRLVETEQIDSLQSTAALTPFNYTLTFDGESNDGGRRLYVFSVQPKWKGNLLNHRTRKSYLLFRGKIYIDATDYAVARVEEQPADTHSFWIKGDTIRHTHEKGEGFWLPQANRTDSKVWLGGAAVLTIDYGKYQFDQARTVTSASTTRSESRRALLEVR